jgi:molecular chaperone DnaK (HSP70)
MAFLPLLGLLLVLVPTLLAYSGFRGRASVVGIDLGTTFSVVAVRATQGGIGAVEVIRDPATGSPIVPSAVYYPPSPSLPPRVGAAARQLIRSSPLAVIYNAKRFIGKPAGDATVAPQAAKQAFPVVPAPPGVAFELPNGTRVSPERVGADVVKHLLSLAALHLGHDRIAAAVIAVPAKFSREQREATADAFRSAGLRVARVREDPPSPGDQPPRQPPRR